MILMTLMMFLFSVLFRMSEYAATNAKVDEAGATISERNRLMSKGGNTITVCDCSSHCKAMLSSHGVLRCYIIFCFDLLVKDVSL